MGEITFETKCYENDWRFLLKTPLLEHMIDGCNHRFSEKRLYINNVKNAGEVKRFADKKVARSVIDSYYLVEDYAKDAMMYFDLKPESFKGGYYYSISELVSIYLSQTKYILHLSSDALPVKPDTDWIAAGIKLLNSTPNLISANALWDNKISEAQSESLKEDKDWWYSVGFSDQNYLIKTSHFKNRIYSDYNEDAQKFPGYGGESFEKRVFSHMANQNLIRAISKNASYYHRTFPKQFIPNRLMYLKMRLFNGYK